MINNNILYEFEYISPNIDDENVYRYLDNYKEILQSFNLKDDLILFIRNNKLICHKFFNTL